MDRCRCTGTGRGACYVASNAPSTAATQYYVRVGAYRGADDVLAAVRSDDRGADQRVVDELGAGISDGLAWHRAVARSCRQGQAVGRFACRYPYRSLLLHDDVRRLAHCRTVET